MAKELWIEAHGHFLYVSTTCGTIAEAIEDFEGRLSSIGCISDNFWHGIRAELRQYDDNGDYKILERLG